MRRIQTSIVFIAMLLLANVSAVDEKKPTLKETLNWIQDRVNSSQFQGEYEQRFSFVINENPSFVLGRGLISAGPRRFSETTVPLKSIERVEVDDVSNKKAILKSVIFVQSKYPEEPFVVSYYPENGGGKKLMKWHMCTIYAPDKEIGQRIRTAILYAVERAKTDPPPKEIF